MRIRMISEDRMTEGTAEQGTNLLDFLRSQGRAVTAPCGGKGTCGKCLVEIEGAGPALACQTILGQDETARHDHVQKSPEEPDLIVHLPSRANALILIDGLMPHHTWNPLIRRLVAQVPEPTLEHQQSDERRFQEASGYQVPFALLPELAAALAADGGRVEFIGRIDDRTVVRFLTGKSPEVSQPNRKRILPGVAVDIGTTTLAAYLYDLENGKRLASAAMVNPQVSYGADVISRIARATEREEDRFGLKNVILQAITRLCVQLLNQLKESDDTLPDLQDIAQITLAGNTTMMHLLTGLPAGNIAKAPFNPVMTLGRTVSASELGLTDFPTTVCTLLPSVASYVGADIVAGLTALGLDRPDHESALLIDIGTNGEIALKTGNRLTACATAAGPAFEGANISCGMSGIAGAIDHVWMNGDELCCSVISTRATSVSVCEDFPENRLDRPAGICGSGLIDAVAVMLETGVIDETGRIGADPDRLPASLRSRLTQVNGQPAFILAFKTDTGAIETAAPNSGADTSASATPDTGTSSPGTPGTDASAPGDVQPVLLTQKDIRELQNAKAAIAAGIQLLLTREAWQPSSVRTIYLAGGFGQYLNVRSARVIGLIPAELSGHVVPAGNTSAMGAICALLDWTVLEQTQRTAEAVVYRELSSDPAFSELYIDALIFPEP